MVEEAIPIGIEEAMEACGFVLGGRDALCHLSRGGGEVVEVFKLRLQLFCSSLVLATTARSRQTADTAVGHVLHVPPHCAGIGEFPVAAETGVRRLVDLFEESFQETVHIGAILPIGDGEVVLLLHVVQILLTVVEVLPIEQGSARRKNGLLEGDGRLFGEGAGWRDEGSILGACGVAVRFASGGLAGLQVGGALILLLSCSSISALLQLPLPGFHRDGFEARQAPLGVVDVALGLAVSALRRPTLEGLRASIAGELARAASSSRHRRHGGRAIVDSCSHC
mmetsp:Transcript_81147/g.178292  ORF Transcript_81147/g.178292 Transcript_81147/m.178292 type:complete len:281 (+) Transcript_81147:1031-1873(+)